jgi:hypothetical protein
MIRYIVMTSALMVSADAPALRIGPDLTLTATVAGIPARLQADPGAPGIPAMNPDFAERAGFKSGMFGTVARIGPVRVRGRSAVIRFDVGSGEYKRRTTWFSVPITPGFDGLIGPGGVPQDVVRFDFRASEPGERETVLPLADFGWSGMGVRVPIGDRSVIIHFTHRRAHSLATAATGAALAAAQGGRMDGAPGRELIELGVERPVRHLSLDTPFTVGPFAIRGVMVRTADFGSVSSVPDADAPPPDPDEIVITGEKKRKQSLTLEIGRDQLDLCSSIVFDKKAKTITLSCR